MGGRLTRQPRHGSLLRTVLFWCHLAAGVVVGLVVLVMSVTGVTLAYERQVLARVASHHRVTSPARDVPRLAPSVVMGMVAERERDARPTGIGLSADPAAPVSVTLSDRRTLFVHPYTGAVLGSDAPARGFFTTMERWHRSLGIGSEIRSPVGTAITGACNAAFLFMIVSGVVLWWPSRWTPRRLRAIAVPSLSARGRALHWNWHHVAGFWCAPVLIMIVGSGVLMSYAHPGGGARAGRRDRGERGAGRAPAEPAHALSLDTIAARAERAVPAWRSLQLRLPRAPGGAVTVLAYTGDVTAPASRVQLAVNPRSGALEAERGERGGRGIIGRLRSWARPVHTGEIGGLVGQTIAVLASAGAVLLVFTGFSLALGRLRRARARAATSYTVTQSR